MNIVNLKETLKQLHASLEATGNVDDELKQLLQVLDSDIRQLLDKEETQEPADSEGLADRAQFISAKFAAEHPQLEPVLRELGAILARMGI